MQILASLKARAGQLKTEVIALYLAARHPRTPWYAKLLIAAIVAYAVSPIDLIPDFIPVIGLLDDVLLLPLGIIVVLKMIPPSVMAECRARASADTEMNTRSGRIGAAVILILWVLLIVLLAVWAYENFA